MGCVDAIASHRPLNPAIASSGALHTAQKGQGKDLRAHGIVGMRQESHAGIKQPNRMRCICDVMKRAGPLRLSLELHFHALLASFDSLAGLPVSPRDCPCHLETRTLALTV